ncbi:unnamed protein product [Didymodactylos carnosus]|uniref:Uncharacterized protein n=1 Tax=Didymodactylos carnosus TaxID=1234261 RepID=A0A814BR74_9BILA|nr:unnamed protein product [Didymodactylos carnosus]CAF3707759.1 unnamed protein product [Didymodactylos carnosus]
MFLTRSVSNTTRFQRTDIPNTPVEDPPRDPDQPKRDGNDGDQSPKVDRNQKQEKIDPNQLPKSPKKNR